jgi:hypothetical protein
MSWRQKQHQNKSFILTEKRLVVVIIGFEQQN